MGYKDPDKQREYQRQWAARRRAAFFDDKSCAWCGSTERLELDHIDPELKVSHRIWSWSEARRAEEVAKCQVLCHDCHLDKTRIDFDLGQKHGTETSYKHYKCRCDNCRAAHAAHFRAYRLRRKQKTSVK